jgi:hypothetical protein
MTEIKTTIKMPIDATIRFNGTDCSDLCDGMIDDDYCRIFNRQLIMGLEPQRCKKCIDKYGEENAN